MPSARYPSADPAAATELRIETIMTADQSNANLHPLGDELVVAPADGTPPPLPATAPRLSIMHLLIWTALSAVFMGYFNLVMRLQPDSMPRAITDWINSPANFAFRTVGSMASGAELGGVLLFVARRWRGLRFPVQPGEWLLFMGGITSLLGMVSYLSLMVTRETLGVGEFRTAAYSLIICLFGIAEYMFPWLGCKDSRAWRWFFFTATVLAFLTLFMTLVGIAFRGALLQLPQPGLIHWIAIGFAAVTFAIAVIGDLRRRTSRGWVHWVGVVALSLQFLNQQASYIYSVISPPKF
jgi:hypothetical protein